MPSSNAAIHNKPVNNLTRLQWLQPLLLAALLMGCGAQRPERYDSEFLAMGTLVQLAMLADNPTEAARWSAQVERALLRQGIDWYPWTQDLTGELKQLNAAPAAGESKVVSPQLGQLLDQALHLHRLSEGYFDPAVAPLTQAWGFAELNTPPPHRKTCGTLAHQLPRLADLHINRE
jgi:thiamine biosynthesis lipoprotein ApbE